MIKKKLILNLTLALISINLLTYCNNNKDKNYKTEKSICIDDNIEVKRDILNLLSTGIDPKQLPEKHTRAAQSYKFYCSQCHSLQKPNSKSASQWKDLIYRMHKEMDDIQKWLQWRDIDIASKEELDLILDYLSRYAINSIDVKKLKVAEGKKEFIENCGSCHDTPDPKQYLFNNWDRTLKRMNSYREEQGFQIIEKDSLEKIKIYLSEY